MDYREFTCAVEERLNQKLTGGVKAGLYSTIKNNGTERTGILIETPGVNISPTIYLEEYYENYREGSSLECIADEIMEFYETIRQERSWDHEEILSYEGVKDRVVFKLINTARNRRFLRKVPHIPFLDLSIVFYVLLEATKEGTAAMSVTAEHIRRWGTKTDRLWADAVKNVRRLLPAELFTMEQAVKEIIRKNAGCGDGSCTENLLENAAGAHDSMYVLSNNLRNYGAACIVYPHMLELIGDILKTDYYVLPSSVHEVVITPCCRDMKGEELDDMVRDINETQVAEEEVLSDHAYLFERNTGKLRIRADCLAGRGIG